jgi:hypothetical protein
MDEAALADAVPQMRRLAEELVPLLLVGPDERLVALRVQWAASTRRIAGASSCGFFLEISVPAEVPRIKAPDFGGGDALIPVAGDEQPSGCILYLVDGALSYLEVYNFVAWVVPPVFGTPTQVEPIVLQPGAAATTPN